MGCYRSTEKKEHWNATLEKATVADLENWAEGLLLRNERTNGRKNALSARGSRGKACFRGPQLQPIENSYHAEFREKEEAGKVVKGQRTKRPTCHANTCRLSWDYEDSKKSFQNRGGVYFLNHSRQ